MRRSFLPIFLIFLTANCVVRHNRITKSENTPVEAKSQAAADKVPMVWVFHESFSYDAVFWDKLLKSGESSRTGFAEAVNKQLTTSRVIERHEHAPLFLDMKSTSERPSYGWTVAFCFLTLGIFPSVEGIHRTTEFTLRDRTTNKEVKKYTYTYRDTTYYSWLTIPVNLFVTPFSKELSGQSDYHAQDMPAAKQTELFESDFASDLQRAAFADSLTRPQIQKPVIAMLQPINRSPEKNSLAFIKSAQTALADGLATFQLDVRSASENNPQSGSTSDDFERFSIRCKETAAKTGAQYVIRLELLSSVYDLDKKVNVVTFQGQIADIRQGSFHNFGPVRFTDKQDSEVSRRAGRLFAYVFLRQLQGFKGTRPPLDIPQDPDKAG